MAHMTHEYGYIDATALKTVIDGLSHQLAEFHKANAALTPDTASAFSYFRDVVEKIATAHTTGSAYARAVHAFESLNHFIRQAARDHVTLNQRAPLDAVAHALVETIPTMLTRAEAFGITRINDPEATSLNIRFSQLLAQNPFAPMPGDMQGRTPPSNKQIARTREAFAALERLCANPHADSAHKLYAARHALTLITDLVKAIANPGLAPMRDVLIHHTRRLGMQLSEQYPELGRLDTATLAAQAGIAPDSIDLAPHLQAHPARSAMPHPYGQSHAN
jgi:hypothetical protein